MVIPSGKRLHNYEKSPFLIGKSTISMAMFNGYVCLPEGTLKLDHNIIDHIIIQRSYDSYSLTLI